MGLTKLSQTHLIQEILSPKFSKEQDWKEFDFHFKELFPAFLPKLKSCGLSISEEKVIMLVKLNLGV